MITATPAHAAVCAAIHASAFPAAESWSAAAFASLLDTQGIHGLIDERAGFVLWRRAAGEAEILTLATMPAVQRSGIARRLLAAALAHDFAAGARRMVLEVAADNHAALALYTGFGFGRCGLRRRYYADGGDALVLQLTAGG